MATFYKGSPSREPEDGDILIYSEDAGQYVPVEPEDAVDVPTQASDINAAPANHNHDGAYLPADAVSEDDGNTAALGTDGLLYVPAVQDTGWRDVTGDLGEDWEGSLLVRRIGATVHFGTAESGIWHNGDEAGPAWTIPEGLRPSTPTVMLTGSGSADAVFIEWLPPGPPILSAAEQADQWYPGGSYVTDDPWPETLPGTPWSG